MQRASISETTDLIIHNGLIRTMNDQNPIAKIVIVKEGKIDHVGDDDTIIDSSGTPIMDLKGKTLLPGFIDTHQHLISTGSSQSALDFQSSQSLEDIFSAVKQGVKTTPKGGIISGGGLSPQMLLEKRMPTLAELDDITQDHGILLYEFSGHMCVANSRLFEMTNLNMRLEGIGRKEGKLTGIVEDPAILDIHSKVNDLMPESARIDAIYFAADLALKAGITTLHCLDGGDLGVKNPPVILQHQEKLPIRTVLYNQTRDIQEIQRMNLPRIGGCILADGAPTNFTAALFEPYANNPDSRGVLINTDEEMDVFVSQAHQAGLQIAIHAVGDRAIEQVLRTYEKAMKKYPCENLRHRIEHCCITHPDQLKRMADSGVAAGIQPVFLPQTSKGPDGLNGLFAMFGEERSKMFYPLRTMFDLGILIAGGSDSPITPYDPLLGVQQSVQHPFEEHRISVEEALKLFTINAAEIAFEEKTKGSIEKGKMADFVVLSDDPVSVTPDQISKITTDKTIVGGKVVYSNGE